MILITSGKISAAFVFINASYKRLQTSCGTLYSNNHNISTKSARNIQILGEIVQVTS